MSLDRRLEERLTQLRGEYETAQKMLAELDQRRTDLEQTLLRISGAIRVLEEMKDEGDEPSGNE